jgi:hypothetical protein
MFIALQISHLRYSAHIQQNFFYANFASFGAGECPLSVTWRGLARCANFPKTRSIAFAATLSRRSPAEGAKRQRMRDRRQRKIALFSRLNLRGIPLRLRKVWPNNEGVRLAPGRHENEAPHHRLERPTIANAHDGKGAITVNDNCGPVGNGSGYGPLNRADSPLPAVLPLDSG